MSRIMNLFIFSLACQLQILANDFKIPLEDGNQVIIEEVKKSLLLSRKDLEKKTTNELVEICLDYPYIIDCFFYNDLEVGVSTEWKLTIIKSDTSRIIYDSSVIGTSKTIGTIGWSPGVYFALAQVNGQYVSCKFVLSK